MRKLRIISLLLMLVTLVSCGSKVEPSLKQAYENEQYILINYDELLEKIDNKENFVFFVSKSNCSSCASYYPNVGNVLDNNLDLKIYNLSIDDMDAIQQTVLAAHFYEAIGGDYYSQNDMYSHIIYTPSTGLVIDGGMVYAKIGSISNDELLKFYQPNYLSFNDYYNFSSKTARNESFVMFFSNENGSTYDEFLRGYFKNNLDKSGTFMNFKDFNEDYSERLLGRINYYLDPSEENVDLHISELPSEFYLVYESGRLVGYNPIKCTVEDLNTLYSK